MSEIEPFTLYQTFNCNIPKKEPTQAQKKAMQESINNLYSPQKKALVRLIIEHARLNNTFKLDNVVYDGLDDGNSLTFDINNIPTDLKWILIKFMKMCAEGV